MVYLSAESPAIRYSLCILEMLVMEISFGQTASHAPVKVHEPNPSRSICATMLSALLFLSGCPCGNKARCAILAAVKREAEAFLQAATQAPQPMQLAAPNAASDLSL